MRSRLAKVSEYQTFQVYSWYLSNSSASLGAGSQQHKPRPTIYMLIGGKRSDPKALKGQAGYNRLFWRTWLPTTGQSWGIALVALAVLLAGGLAQGVGLYSVHSAAYVAPLTTSSVPPILVFVLCYSLHSLVGGWRRLASGRPLRLGGVLGVVALYYTTARGFGFGKLASEGGAGAPSHPSLSLAQLSMLHTTASGRRIQAPHFTWISSLGFRLGGYTLLPPGVSYGFKTPVRPYFGAELPLSPLANGEFAKPGLMFVRLVGIGGQANSLAWGALAHQPLERTRAVRLLISAWRVSGEAALAGPLSPNTSGDGKLALYRGALQRLALRAPEPSGQPAYTSPTNHHGTSLPDSSDAGIPTVEYNDTYFKLGAVQTLPAPCRTKPWSKL